MILKAILGTRPEAIKLASVIKHTNAGVISTGQHSELLDTALQDFNIKPDVSYGLMWDKQTPLEFIAVALPHLKEALSYADGAIVVGDTATAYAGALAAKMLGIDVYHVEAGLRTNDQQTPFPEEIFRCGITHLADTHFAPTENARNNLSKEGKRSIVVGSTSVDALEMLNIKRGTISDYALVTIHRRESRGAILKEMIHAVDSLGIPTIIMAHPAIEEVIEANVRNAMIMSPRSPKDFYQLLAAARIVVTDSGGMQEECLHLGIPLFILRDKTEWVEGVEAGGAILVGRTRNGILKPIHSALSEVPPKTLMRMEEAPSSYGNGKAGLRIAELIGC